MLSPGALVASREILGDGREFYRESHARIWRAALSLADRGEPVDAITLGDELEQRGQLDDVGGNSRLYELARLVPATANVAHYARIVAETAELREFIRAGAMLQRLGWDRPGSIEDLREQRDAIVDGLTRGTGGTTPIESETWAQFERSATEQIPMLVDGLWPESGLGFIAAPPKKGKTWIGLSLAISVATGKPFLASFQVAKPEPVVLIALEGHRAAIRGRVGALAHGLDLQPQGGDDLHNLHIVYKPAGLNLADPAWIRTVHELVQRVGARLLIVDVLRAAAVMKENSNDEFRDLVRALQPLQELCAIALLHHFGKLTELSKERTPGERMAGAGAMYGAFDVGVFITKSDQGARELRVEFETRDVVAPDPVSLKLDGDTTGQKSGFVFADAASWTVIEDAPVDDDTASFLTWLEQQPDMSATTDEIAYALDIHPKKIQRTRPKWVEHGVEYEPSRGAKPARYYLPSWWTNEAAGHVHQPEDVHQETLDLQELPDESCWTGQRWTNDDVHQPKTPDLQVLPLVDKVDSPTESSAPVSGMPLTDDTDDLEIDWSTP